METLRQFSLRGDEASGPSCARRPSRQGELSRMKLRSNVQLASATSLQGVGVDAVIAAVHLESPETVALPHRPAHRCPEFAPVPASGPRGRADKEVDQLVDKG